MEQLVTQSAVTHLECSRTGETYDIGQAHNTSAGGWPLLVRYDLESLRSRWDRDALAEAPQSMWRYAPLLPVRRPENIVSLHEGWTPLHRLDRLASASRVRRPLGEGRRRQSDRFVQGARYFVRRVDVPELGIQKVAIPTAGNAGGALAAYAAAAGIEAHIFMPRDVPLANYLEARGFGAKVTLVDGLISDCGRLVAEGKASQGWFEVSTLKEPYRIEGKKTMGLEAAEQFGWELPDAIFYPTGGGVGMIGMWKAFAELEQLGWIGPKRPKMIAVQADGCQPIVRAFEQGAEFSEFWQNAATVASGLRVPKPLGDFLVLQAVRESGGTAVAVSERDMMAACEDARFGRRNVRRARGRRVHRRAAGRLRASGFLKASDRILIYNTGSGYKYLEAWAGHCRAVAVSGKLDDHLTSVPHDTS